MNQKHFLLQVTRADQNIDVPQDKNKKNFTIVYRFSDAEERSQPVKGSELEWKTYFPLDLNDKIHTYFELELLMDEVFIGAQKITFKRVKREILGQNGTVFLNEEYKVNLEKQGKHTATIYINIDEYENLDLIGGVDAPKIKLYDGRSMQESVSEIQVKKEDNSTMIKEPSKKMEMAERKIYGLEVNRTEKLNLFSCMDENNMQMEFFPSKFKTKCSKL